MRIIAKVGAKLRQCKAFVRQTQTPFPLIADSFRMRRKPFVAVSRAGLKLDCMPAAGDSFTFYENLIRQDYLQNGIRLDPGGVVIDVGANIGAFSILAASKVGCTGRVIAVEPANATYRRLVRNIEINGLNNIAPVNCALGDRQGVLQLSLSSKSAYASLFNGCDGRSMQSTETVAVWTLEQLITKMGLTRIHLLKLDCEGGEYGVLDTLQSHIAKTIDQVSMEVHSIPGRKPDEIPARLEALGFTVRKTYPLVAFRKRDAEA